MNLAEAELRLQVYLTSNQGKSDVAQWLRNDWMYGTSLYPKLARRNSWKLRAAISAILLEARQS